MHSYTIETDRLILRPLSIQDCDAVYKWVSDEDVARYMVYPTYTSKDRLLEWLASLENDDEYHFGFVKKDGNELIGSGSIGPDAHRDGFWSFGYNFRKDQWGYGYATEAAKAMIRFSHEQFGICRFSSSHVEANKASGHVMEKCGLHFVRYGEFEKLDGSCKACSMEYEGKLFEGIDDQR
ncbi:MAG: GNAT family N-acetyltransferase [Lachnospiraceae bacterium]|nr:GNAT family N-acetyltransferase [Lachnospiraceae bacterium]